MTGSTIKGQIQREDLALFDGNTMTATRPNSSGGVQTGNRVGDAVDVKLVHGGSSNSASFQKAVDAMGTQNGSLLFTPETWNITSNITVPANVTLIVPAGCVFNIDGGVTITNAGILFRFHKTFTSGSGTFTQNGTDILQIAGQSDIYGLDTGSTNTYVISTQASFSQYVTGLTVRFEPTSTNTGAATLNVDNLGAKTLRPVGSSSDVPVGSIKSGGIYTAVYDGGSDIFQVSDAFDLANISASGDITLDAGGDIILDADGADISFKDAGTEFGKISNSSSDLVITASVADKDIKFSGTDGSSAITPLTIDMSEEGKIITSGDVEIGDDLSLKSDSAVLSMGTDSDLTITHNHNVGITLNDKDISGVSSINSDSFGARNYIINPEFAFSQRGINIDSSKPNSNANNDSSMIIDCYRLLSDGNNIVKIFQTEVDSDTPTGSLTALEAEVVTEDKKFGFSQTLEQIIAAPLFGKTVTLSFMAKASASMTDLRCCILSWSGDSDLPTADIVSAWNDSSTNPSFVSNYTLEGSTPASLSVGTSYSRHSITVDVDTSNVKNLVVFIWSNSTSNTAGEKIHLGQLQLQVGSQMTSFSHPNFMDVQNQCFRYLLFFHAETDAGGTSVGNLAPLAQGHAFSTSARMIMNFPAPMRICGTFTGTTSGLGYAGKSTIGSSITGFTSVQTSGQNMTAITFNITYGSNVNYSQPSGVDGLGSMRLVLSTGFLGLSAELGV